MKNSGEVRMKNSGLHANRLKREHNEEELRFARAWDEHQQYNTLGHLLGNGLSAGAVSPRDRQVAATVIQWLGAPVGQEFLRELGYKKT